MLGRGCRGISSLVWDRGLLIVEMMYLRRVKGWMLGVGNLGEARARRGDRMYALCGCRGDKWSTAMV